MSRANDYDPHKSGSATLQIAVIFGFFFLGTELSLVAALLQSHKMWQRRINYRQLWSVMGNWRIVSVELS